MPSDAENSVWWSSNPDQPLDFSKKARVQVYPQPPPTSTSFHASPNGDSDSTPLTMGFYRPDQQRSSPPPPMPLHPYTFLDPIVAVNDSFRPPTFLPQLPFQFLDTRRPPTKNLRPFKAYPRDPLTLPLGYCGLSSPVVDIQQGLLLNDDSYADFRKNVLLASSAAPKDTSKDRDDKEKDKMSPRNGEVSNRNEEDVMAVSSIMPDSSPSTSCCSGMEMSTGKRKPRTLPDELKDDAYWERRRKNNEAAKRSRDARRAKEDEIAIRAAYLEQENLKLKVELATMKNETTRLRCMLYNS